MSRGREWRAVRWNHVKPVAPLSDTVTDDER